MEPEKEQQTTLPLLGICTTILWKLLQKKEGHVLKFAPDHKPQHLALGNIFLCTPTHDEGEGGKDLVGKSMWTGRSVQHCVQLVRQVVKHAADIV